MYQQLNTMSDKELVKLLVKEVRNNSIDRLFDQKSLPQLVYDTSLEELLQIDGIGPATADKLMVIQVILKRIASGYYKESKPKITYPQDVYKLMKPIIGYESQEEFHILLLNTKHVVLDRIMISRGTLNASIVTVRDIYLKVLRHGGVASVCRVHNHPSGDTRPSSEDLALTERLVDVGKELVGIPILDHVIIDDDYYSFKENQLL